MSATRKFGEPDHQYWFARMLSGRAGLSICGAGHGMGLQNFEGQGHKFSFQLGAMDAANRKLAECHPEV